MQVAEDGGARGGWQAEADLAAALFLELRTCLLAAHSAGRKATPTSVGVITFYKAQVRVGFSSPNRSGRLNIDECLYSNDFLSCTVPAHPQLAPCVRPPLRRGHRVGAVRSVCSKT